MKARRENRIQGRVRPAVSGAGEIRSPVWGRSTEGRPSRTPAHAMLVNCSAMIPLSRSTL
jgi:hypothetical protein